MVMILPMDREARRGRKRSAMIKPTISSALQTNQRDGRGHGEEIAHLLFGISNAFNKACLVDFQQTREILRLILADMEHENIVMARTETP